MHRLAWKIWAYPTLFANLSSLPASLALSCSVNLKALAGRWAAYLGRVLVCSCFETANENQHEGVAVILRGTFGMVCICLQNISRHWRWKLDGKGFLQLEEIILILNVFIMSYKRGIRDENLLLARRQEEKMLIINTFINNKCGDVVERGFSFLTHVKY